MSEKNESSTSAESTPTILCVDDQPEFVDALSRQLHKYQVKICPAYHGLQGIWLGLTEKPDLIITDFKMPFADGSELTQVMQHVPVIAITGMLDREVKDALLAAGARSVFTKPYDVRDLVREIARWIPMKSKAQVQPPTQTK